MIEIRTITEVLVDGRCVDRREVSQHIDHAQLQGEASTTAATSDNSMAPPAAIAKKHPAAPSQPPPPPRPPGVFMPEVVRFVASLVEHGKVWDGFEGLSPAEIAEHGQVRREVAALELVGVHRALELVVELGPKRCQEVRSWVDSVKKKQRCENPAGLIVSLLKKGPPKGAAMARRRHSA